MESNVHANLSVHKSPSSANTASKAKIAILSTLGLSLIYASLWSLPRLPLFQVPAMMHDDYFMADAVNVYKVFYIQEYRILGGVYPTICKWVFSDFYASSTAIVLNAVLIGVICTQLFRVLLLLGIHSAAAGIFIFLFCWHPIINDLSAWNTPGFALVSLILMIASFLTAWKGGSGNCLFAALLMTGSLATYQLMLTIPMCLAVLVFAHRAAVHRHWEWGGIASVATALVLGLSAYLTYVVVVSPMLFGKFEGSPIKSIQTVVNGSRILLHESISLYLNIFSPPLSHCRGIMPAMQSWYYIPMGVSLWAAILIMIRVAQKQLSIYMAPLLFATWVGLPFLAILPMWMTNISTMEWRVSIVMLIPQVVVYGSVLGMWQGPAAGRLLCNRSYMFASIVVLLVSLVLANATYADCRMRIDDFLHDKEIVNSIKDFRESLGSESASHGVVWIQAPQVMLHIQGDERSLMKASFVINTYSTFSYGRIWANQVFRWYDLEPSTADEVSVESLENEPHVTTCVRRRLHTLPYVMHFRDRRLSVVVGERQWYSWTAEPR